MRNRFTWLAAALLLCFSAQAAELKAVGNSGENSELVTQLKLLPAPPYESQVIYSLPMPNIAAGDILDFGASFVITSDESYLTRTVIEIFLADSPTATTGTELAEGYTENMDNAVEHHRNYPISGNWVADNDYSGKFLNVVAFSAASLAPSTAPLQYVTVEQDYGRLHYLLFGGLTQTAPPPPGSFMSATGGTVTTSGNYKIHTFTSGGDFVVTNPGDTGSVDYLVIAGGGGGSNSGGGAGGYLTGTDALNAGTYPIVVGAGGSGGLATAAGGAAGTSGGDSSFNSHLSIGGSGGVQGGTSSVPLSGGSGAGAGAASSGIRTAGTGTVGQGNNGGTNGVLASPYPSGGGGGAGSAGCNGATAAGGAGGAGLASSITGTSVTRAGGGGGALYVAGGTGGAGGAGGGGAGKNAAGAGNNATANTGSGGGGAISGSTGGNGATGVVIIKYRFQ